MSICLTWVPFCELGEPNIYHNLDHFTRKWEFYLEGVLLWRISGAITGDDGFDGGDFTWRVVNMNLLLKNG